MSNSQRIAVIAGVALLVAVGLVVALQLAGGRAPSEPPVAVASRSGAPSPAGTEEASASPSATAATAAPTGDAPNEAEILELFGEIEEEVLEIRGLAAPDIGPADLLSRDDLRDYLVDQFEAEYPEADREADNVTLRALGVLGPEDDIAELQLSLLGESVVGFYDDQERRMAVVSDSGVDAEALRTYAHEYTHALQDGAFGLDELDLDVEGDDDAALARLSLVEGDAMLTMELWSLEHLDEDRTIEGNGGGEEPDAGPPLDIPDFLIDSLFFPYTVGSEFVVGLYQEGGFEAVDAAFADPPESTEQLLHPEAYAADEQPVEVELPDLAAALGTGWEQVESTPMGEATLRIIIDDLADHELDASAASAGWGGDRLVVAAGPDDSFALAWKFAWDTPEDAAEFAEIYRQAIAELDFPAEVVELADGTVLVAQASSEALVESVIAAAD